MKKSLCVIIAVIMCMAFVFAGCQPDDTQGSVVDHSSPENYAFGNANNNGNNDGTPVISDIEIEEGETVSQASLGTETELFLKSNYYLEGTIYTDGEKLPAIIATDGYNLELTAMMGGISIGILILDDQTYTVNPKTKSYTELSDMLVRTLGLNNIDMSSFQNVRDDDNLDANIVQNAVTINGEPGICSDYVYNDTSIKLYSIGDKLVQVENYDEKGNLTMQIVVDSITGQIPADQLTLKGLTQQSIPAFLSSFISG